MSLRIFPNTQQIQALDDSSITLPLRFLPKGGCWALKIIVSDEEHDVFYYGVLDTGSPFLTAPSSVINVTQTTTFPISQEQYGESTGEILWRKAPYLTLLGNPTIIDSENVVLGVVASSILLQETGGIFAGMMTVDDNRPSFLQQIGGGYYTSFVISFAQNYLELKRGSAIEKRDPEAFPLVNLQPYGPDLHHFAIDCPQFEIIWNDGSKEIIASSTLKRPVWVVLDTGLTGCIFSDSLYSEIRSKRGGNSSTPIGLTASLMAQNKGILELRNSDQYWIFSSFRLPWFDDEDHHPHIIALGCTFWANCERLTIDTLSSRAKIVLRDLNRNS
jgi:hypothetical protein